MKPRHKIDINEEVDEEEKEGRKELKKIIKLKLQNFVDKVNVEEFSAKWEEF